MAEQETTKINLANDITVNGVRYPAGKSVEVPKAQADDIARIDFDHQEYKAGLLTRKVYEKNAGTMAVGSAE